MSNIIERQSGYEIPSIFHEMYQLSLQDSDGPQGPEPYIAEYEFGTLLTESLVAAGFKNVEQIDYSYFDSLFLGTK